MFNYCQTSVLSLSTEGSLVNHRGYKPYTLVGPPVCRSILAPLAVNSLTTDYVVEKTGLLEEEILHAELRRQTRENRWFASAFDPVPTLEVRPA